MDHGVVNLTIIPVRAHFSDASEMVTQLLFGETFTIVGRNEQWVNICTTDDKYIGWIDEKQFVTLNDKAWKRLQKMDKVYSNGLLQKLTSRDRQVQVLHGSVFYIDRNEIFLMDEKFEYNLLEYTYPEEKPVENVIASAYQFLGAPYLWGGRSMFGIDCSGFTQLIYKLNGYQIPRDASQQVEFGDPIDPNFAQTGDLVFFINDQERIHHVGILVSDDEIMHAAGKVRIDFVDEAGIYNEELKKYTHRFHSVRRIIK